MQLLTGVDLDAAERFVWLSGRLLDRRRFDHLFRGGSPDAVLEALRPYRNADGGFGSALEPDLRGPSSQPVPAEHALRVLHDVDRFADPIVTAVCDWLLTVTRPDGGVPFVLPSVRTEPRAPWWETGDDPPGSLNPTASLAGLLHAHAVDHPWLGPATEFCWRGIEDMATIEGYELRAALLFLDHVPDRARAEQTADRLRDLVAATRAVELDPDAAHDEHVLRPLDFASSPDSTGCRLFPDAVIERNLAALAAGQREDGGWTIDFEVWTPATGPEWRAHVTIEALKVLRAHAR